MKTLKKLLFGLLTLTLIISACKKDSDGVLTLDMETISAKWLVSGTSDYSSFEFNKSGNYLVILYENTSNEQIVFGKYTISESTITLADYGTIIVSEIKESSISFIIKTIDNPTIEVNISANKQDEMESSSNTDMLCKTWDLVTMNGEPVDGTDMELTVLFSRAGTYFVNYANDGYDEARVAQWKWKNTEETELYYSWEEVPNWETAAYVIISELTSTYLEIVEDDLTYGLQPASTKSSSVLSQQNSSLQSKSDGIFGNR